MDTLSAKELLKEMIACGHRAGVAKYMFLGFGTMLGAIRDNSFIPHDDDMDICFLPISAELKDRYLDECIKAGLMDGWPDSSKRISSKPSGELLWFSTKKTEKGARSCNWFFIYWDDCLWHTKGRLWVSDLHFDPKLGYKSGDEGIMLGAPSEYFNQLSEIKFEGLSVNIPKLAGTLCDLYYPGWLTPKEGGSSAQDRIARIPRWSEEDEWKNLL
jgi:hypothetical protein